MNKTISNKYEIIDINKCKLLNIFHTQENVMENCIC